MNNLNNMPIVFLPGLGFKGSLASHLGLPACRGIDLPVWQESMSLMEVLEILMHSLPDNALIIGWSLGGLIGLLLREHFPQRIQKLILVNASPKFTASENWFGITEEQVEQFIALGNHQFDLLLNSFIQLVQFPDKSKVNRAILKANLEKDENSFKQYLTLLLTLDLRDTYRLSQVPIYQIFGSLDAILPGKVSDNKLLSAYPIYHIPDGGHAVFLSHQKIFADLIQEIIING